MSFTPHFTGYESRIGLEDFGRAIYIELLENVNTAMIEEAARWAAADLAFNQRIGRKGINSTLEPFREETMHIGHRPSMIEAPVQLYPSMAVMAFRSIPQPDSNDQSDTSQISVAVEFIVRSGPFKEDDVEGDGESAVNQRALRTTEAVNKVVTSARHQDYFISPEKHPVVTVGDVWVRAQDVNTGPRWYFQGVRLEYSFKKMSPYGSLEIDQG